MKKHTIIIRLWILLSFCSMVNAQITLTTTTQINTVCNGNPCIYNGPKILINEVMLTPPNGDGSIIGQGGNTTGHGEWIELYNPDICQSIDVSCFFLGNNAPNDATNPAAGGFVIPNGTIVPPRGFVVIRGMYAPAVASNLLIQNGGKTIEIVLNSSLSNNICIIGGTRLWFPNNGGWFAFYDNNGVPQDAISWFNQANSCLSCNPCNPQPSSCGYSGSLASYDNFPPTKKNYITTLNPGSYIGKSFRRLPDGGNWDSSPSFPTYGTCNSFCIPPPNITCNGKAVVFVTGGQPPYTFLWNDQQATANDTVTGLCDGIYTVTVTDAHNNIATTSVQIYNIELKATISSEVLSCRGGNDGKASAFVTNGRLPYHFLWSNGDTTSTIQNLIADKYTVEITDANDCKVDTNIVIADSAVVLTVSINDAVICSRTNVKLTATPLLSGGNFSWSPDGQLSAAITVSPIVTSNYSVIYSYAGCIAGDTSLVTVNPTPLLFIHASLSEIMQEDSVVIAANGGLSYLWNNGYTTDTIIMFPMDDTIYCVTASNNNGCYDTKCIKIDVVGNSTLYIPNTFTPNGDGINDRFFVAATNIDKFQIHIYNRWGNLLFESNNLYEGWDGQYNGALVPEGLYVYSVKAKGEDGKDYRKSGTVTVLW